MTVFCVAQAKLNNKDALAKYKENSTAALAKHGGAVVSASPKLVTLDGVANQSDLVVILSFPTEDDAQNWRNDESLTELHALREASGEWSIHMLASVA